MLELSDSPLFRILEVIVSNVGLEIGYRLLDILCYSLVPPRKLPGEFLKLGHDLFHILSNLIIYHQFLNSVYSDPVTALLNEP
jgi:hypothetical protein